MDQPTSIEMTIKGQAEDVKRAALAAQRRIDIETKGFKESAYEYGDGSDFKTKMDDVVDVLGDYEYTENSDGTAVFSTEQESYGCIEERNIKEIADDIVKTSPNVEAHISAVITITYEEGYDLCVEADYVDGKLSVESSEEYYEWDDEDDDED